MPVSKLTLMRATALFTLIGLAALLAMVALSMWMLERTRTATEEVLATREMRSGVVDLFSVVQDAETGQRGYLLTGEDRYLRPYEEAVKRTDVGITRLADVMRRQPGSDDFIGKLRPLIAAKMAELAQTVDLKRAGKSDEAMALVLSDRGKNVMDGIARCCKTSATRSRRASTPASKRNGRTPMRCGGPPSPVACSCCSQARASPGLWPRTRGRSSGHGQKSRR